MKLYKNSNGVWAGTQADARKMCGKDYSTVDVPVDKPRLLKNSDPDLNKKAMSYFKWGYDKLCSGQYDDGKELIRQGLLYKLQGYKEEETDDGNNN